MSEGYDFINCAKRLGRVLIGQTEPSVLAVRAVAQDITRRATGGDPALQAVYEETLREPVPQEFYRLLDSLTVEPARASH